MLSSLPLVLKRTLAHWRLLSAVIIGVVLAVTIMASSVIFFESLRDLALDRALEKPLPTEIDVLVEASDTPASFESHREINARMDATVIQRLRPFLNAVEPAVKSWTFFPDLPPPVIPAEQCSCRAVRLTTTNQDGSPVMLECDCRRVAFYSINRAPDRLKMVDGRLPEPELTQPEPGQTLVVEAALDSVTAARHQLSVGSIYPAKPHWEDEHTRVDVLVTGIFERNDPDDAVWRIYDDSFGTRGTSLDFLFFVVPEQTVFGALGSYFPRMGADWAWLLDVDPDAIHAADTAGIRGTVLATENELRAVVDGFLMETELPETLRNFEEDLFFNRLPMFIVLILIVLVVLYYVVTLASLLVDAQRSEVALLRSRGATSFQILGVFFLESAVLALLGLVVGPLLALGGVSLIGALPPYHSLNDGALLPVQFTSGVMKLALIGAGLSLVALLFPAIRASRIGLLIDKRARARPQRLAFIQRYYLDLGFLGLAVFLFWQLTKQGSFVGVQIFGERTVNQLVLAVPAVFMVAAGVILLRLFPLIMDLLGRALSARWAGRIVPPSIVLGLWQMARNPAHHARLSLLLILTAGLGVFAASFAATLEQGSRDRAYYDSGADLRTTSLSTLPGGQSFSTVSLLESTSGVTAATAVYRERASVTAAGQFAGFTVLGVDPDQIGDVAYFRDDFAGRPVTDVLPLISSPEPAGIEIPMEARWISLLVKPLVRQQDTLIVARMSDSNGRFYTLPLGTLTPSSVDNLRFGCPSGEPDEPPEWCRVGASLWPNPGTGFPALAASAPLRLHSIGVALNRTGNLVPGAIDIDDVTVLLGAGQESLVIEPFDTTDNWRRVFSGLNSLGDSFSLLPDSPGVVRFRWTEGISRELRGLNYGSSVSPLPVLASESFMSEFGARVGQPVSVVIASVRMDVVVKEVIKYFPTLDPNDGPFAVADLRDLHPRVNTGLVSTDRQPTEYWVDTVDVTEPGVADIPGGGTRVYDPTRANIERTFGGVRVRYGQILDRVETLDGVAIDPLVSSGWRALLGMAFFTVLVVSAVGFLVHTRVSFSARRLEFALLRTIGLSMRQLLTLVVLEQLLVIGAAVALGVVLGSRLGVTIMPYLANSGEGVRLAPPMLVQVDWAGLAVTFGLFAAVFVGVLAAIIISVYAMSIHKVMRMGDA